MCPWLAGSVADPQHTFKTRIAFATLRANWNESKRWPTWNDEQREEEYADWLMAVQRTLDWVDVGSRSPWRTGSRPG
jgi:glycerol kinase